MISKKEFFKMHREELKGLKGKERLLKLKELSKRWKEETYEERRKLAFQHGHRHKYITCLLCGRNFPLKIWGKRKKFEVKPDFAVITTRVGGGRSIGYFLDEKENVYLKDLKKQYPEIYANLKEQIKKLYDLFFKSE